MLEEITKYSIFDERPAVIVQSTNEQVLVFKRRDLLFVFNFSPVKSYTDYPIDVSEGVYNIILNTDESRFDGFDLVEMNYDYITRKVKDKDVLKLYIPARSAYIMSYRKL